ncbi:hypothetical protein HRG_011371 [Hirsutella rhossiliensis]|uniref:Uncharacterized protein n=1 Tax=Hirsutella rhossiliensis TaxID=111463 RepID=A0A9P8SD54_9HYPO|nr:uncharacterized protein HRG_11371 [Hirsutella rhossiliensis]KAH0957589.1 hypothetical protein HRG_11371 [Hirsutella rhossiliensis]
MAAASPVPIRISSSSSSPSPSPSSFFQLPTRRRKQTRLMEQQKSEQAAVLQEELSLRTQAWVYLEDFLHNSQWSDQMDRITIVRDAVPTMPELNAYGDLDEKEGTRACRRLFKAVVIWDELGHSLWGTLRAASEQRQLAQRQFEMGSPRRSRFPDELRATAAYTSRRPSRRSSEDSYDSDYSFDSCDSFQSSTNSLSGAPPVPPLPAAFVAAAAAAAEKKPRIKLPKRLSRSSGSASSSSGRPSCEMEPAGADVPLCLDQQHDAADPSALDMLGRSPPRDGDSSPSAFPRIFSHNWAVRKRLGVFGDSRPSTASAPRQSYSHHQSHQSS